MNHLQETLQVDTPENVAFGYDVAGIGSRFLAALVDTTLLVLINLFFALLTALLAGSLGASVDDFAANQAWLSAILGLVAFLFFWGYYIFFEMLWNGQSPGKRWAGLRVLRVDGLPVTLSESIIRNLIRLVDFMPMAYGVGVVVMFVHPQARRLGDLAAGTLVVRDRDAIALAEPPRLAPALEHQAPELPLTNFSPERLSPQDLQLVQNFLQRRAQLKNRHELALQLARRLHTKMGLDFQLQTPLEADDFLESIARAAHIHQE